MCKKFTLLYKIKMNILGVFMHNTGSKSVFNTLKTAGLPKTGGFKLFPPSFPHCFQIGYSFSIDFHTY